jgi:hypothetical protein
VYVVGNRNGVRIAYFQRLPLLLDMIVYLSVVCAHLVASFAIESKLGALLAISRRGLRERCSYDLCFNRSISKQRLEISLLVFYHPTRMIYT